MTLPQLLGLRPALCIILNLGNLSAAQLGALLASVTS